MSKNIILGELGGYVANQALENGEYRLDTPEPENISTKVAHNSPTSAGVAGLGRWLQRGYQNLFNSNANKAVEEGKAQG